MSAVHVSTRMKRVTFVKGEVTSGTPAEGFVACGPGTPFPMEVTEGTVADKFDIIAEVLYRVKEAKFISGSATMSEEGSLEFIAPTTQPPTRAFTRSPINPGDPYSYFVRGYTTPQTAVPVKYDPYLQVGYDRGDGEMYRDVSDNERGMWLPYAASELPHWNDIPGSDSERLVTAFSFNQLLYGSSDPGGSNPDPDFFQAILGSEYIETNGYLFFRSQIAVVKTNPTDGLFASTNRFFIGLELTMESANMALMNQFWISTQKFDWDLLAYPDARNVVCCNYVIRLSEDVEISCPIYGVAFDDFPYGTNFSGYDFIHEATKWWPYANDTPIGFVWGSDTGIKIPIGAGFLDANDPDEALAIYTFF